MDTDPRKDERKRIQKDLAPAYAAAHKGMTVEQATQILADQLLRQVDATEGAKGNWNDEAASYLKSYAWSHPGETVGKDQWGNDVPLFGTAAGYQRSDSTIFSRNPQMTNRPSDFPVLKSMWDWTKGVAGGISDKVMHPKDTLSEVISGIYGAFTDGEGTLKKGQENSRKIIEQAGQGNFKPAGQQVGEHIGTTAVVTATGLAVGSTVSKVGAAISDAKSPTVPNLVPGETSVVSKGEAAANDPIFAVKTEVPAKSTSSSDVGSKGTASPTAGPSGKIGQSVAGTDNAPSSSSVLDMRTKAADEAGQNVINVMDGLISSQKSPVVQILTHEDGTVSVGISGNINVAATADRIATLQAALDKEFGAGKYKVGTTTLDETNGVAKAVDTDGNKIGNAPGVCAEPKACAAAGQNQSPITGSATLWRGKGPNPYEHTGPNASNLSPNQMDPCPTCAKPSNQVIYNDTAKGGKKGDGK